MNSLKTLLMSSVAAVSLAASPALAQQSTDQTDAPGMEQNQGAQGAEIVASQRSYDESYGERFAEWGDKNVEELMGTGVVNDAGENIGEIDNFGLSGDTLVAIIGVGGFLGMGEHQVAVPIDQLSFNGDQLVLSGVTREDLEAMPEYDEQEAPTLAGDQTLRSGYESTSTDTAGNMQGTSADTETAQTDTAAVQPSDSSAADQPMDDVEEEVADAADAGAANETTVEDQMAAGGESAEQNLEQAGENVEQAAEATGQAVENATEEAADEVAEAGQDAAQEVDQATHEAQAEVAEEADEMTADSQTAAPAGETDTAAAGSSGDASSEQPMATDTETAQAETPDQGGGDAMSAETETADSAQSADQQSTDVIQAEGDAEVVQEGTDTASSDSGWTQEMDTIFADIADRQITELIGMEVASADGEVVGEVDNFALQGQDVVAIVGVGGFLGLGEHEVALPLGEMTYDGERLVLSSLTEDQIRDMPEFDEEGASYLPEDGTLRSSYQQ